MKILLFTALAFFLCGCGGSIAPPSNYILTKASPDGTSEAFICEVLDYGSKGRTDLMLYQKNRSGAAGAVYFQGTNLGLRIDWIDDGNLRIIYPKNTDFTINASGDIIQFIDSKIRLHLESTENE